MRSGSADSIRASGQEPTQHAGYKAATCPPDTSNHPLPSGGVHIKDMNVFVGSDVSLALVYRSEYSRLCYGLDAGIRQHPMAAFVRSKFSARRFAHADLRTILHRFFRAPPSPVQDSDGCVARPESICGLFCLICALFPRHPAPVERVCVWPAMTGATPALRASPGDRTG